MKFELIDTHCHLQFAAYAGDRDAVIDNALKQGIGMIAVGTNIASSKAAVELAESVKEGVWASVAIHPGHVSRPHHDKNETADVPQEEFFDDDIFSRLIKSEKVVAIGETGLDYYRLPSIDAQEIEKIKQKQRDNLEAHIAFAIKNELPLIMHVRDAHDDALTILKSAGCGFRGVMHSFGGTADEARQYLELGHFIGIGGIVTFPPRKGEAENMAVAVARAVPDGRILVETDAPYISPAPLRGKRNEPRNVIRVAQEIAKIRGVSYDEISRMTTANAVKLFNLAD